MKKSGNPGRPGMNPLIVTDSSYTIKTKKTTTFKCEKQTTR